MFSTEKKLSLTLRLVLKLLRTVHLSPSCTSALLLLMLHTRTRSVPCAAHCWCLVVHTTMHIFIEQEQGRALFHAF